MSAELQLARWARSTTVDNSPIPRRRLAIRIFSSIVLLAAAVALTILLAVRGGISFGELRSRIWSTPLWLLALFAVLSVAQVILSAWKWQLVMREAASAEQSHQFDLLYKCTALSMLVSQFMTVYLSSIVVRAWGLKRSHGTRPAYSAGTSLYEQIFDVAVLLVMAAPTLLVWALDGSFGAWVIATAVAVVAGGGALPLLPFALRKVSGMKLVGSRLERLGTLMNVPAGARLMRLSFMRKLYAISIIRYFTMLARIPALVMAFWLPLRSSDTLPGFTLVQATQLAAITPGQLGIREWTWSGILSARGYDLGLAAQFAIDLRVLGFFASVVVVGTCLVPFRRLVRRQ